MGDPSSVARRRSYPSIWARDVSSRWSSRSPLGCCLLLLIALACASCPKPTQYGGSIPLDPAGMAGRFRQLCRLRHTEVGGTDPCAIGAEAPRPEPARAHRMAEGEQLTGPMAMGRAGDYLIENGEVVFVIEQLGRGFGFAEGGGNVVDAADAHGRQDELSQITTRLGEFPGQAVYDRLDAGTDVGGVAFVEARGRDLHLATLSVVTRYVLSPGARALALITRVTNEGNEVAREVDLGDNIAWGAVAKVAPDRALGFKGPSSGPFLGGIGRSTSYVIVPRTGALSAMSGETWSDTRPLSPSALSPGESISYERSLAVGVRSDMASVVAESRVLAGSPLGGLEITLLDSAGAPLAARFPEGRATLRSPRGPLDLWFSLAAASQPGSVGGELPPGLYQVTLEDGPLAAKAVPAEVRANEVAHVTMAIEPGGKIAIRASEKLRDGTTAAGPAKLTLVPERNGAQGRAWASAEGKFEIDVAPGRYRALVSRGPEFDQGEAVLEVEAGGIARADLSLSRVVDTAGYVACDLHQHAALSGDAAASDEDRVLSNVVEGVECGVASEHNAVGDLGPVVRKLGLGSRFLSIPGDEISSDASERPFGHANAFPLSPAAGSDLRAGAPAVRDLNSHEAFALFRALSGPPILQINHPLAKTNGYFTFYRFDPAIGRGQAPAYDEGFDALEVWNGNSADQREEVLRAYYALLLTGHPVTPTANSDTHGFVGHDGPTGAHEAGYPRTFVAVDGDDPAALRPEQITRGIRELRDVVLTNGPFVRLRAGDVRQGGMVRARGGKVALKVHVERAPWVDATSLALVVGGIEQPAMPLAGRITALGARADDISVTLPVRSDTFIMAIVRGERSLGPAVTGGPFGTTPFAITSPIWVDADGDGKSLGR